METKQKAIKQSTHHGSGSEDEAENSSSKQELDEGKLSLNQNEYK